MLLLDKILTLIHNLGKVRGPHVGGVVYHHFSGMTSMTCYRGKHDFCVHIDQYWVKHTNLWICPGEKMTNDKQETPYLFHTGADFL